MTASVGAPLALPIRRGPRPLTTTRIPHSQLDQQPEDDRLLTAILAQAATWPRVRRADSQISVEDAPALTLDGFEDGPREAFLAGSEFAHGHAQGDTSLHAALPLQLADAAEKAGWAEPHFLVHHGVLPPNIVMLYAPRDEAEARVLLDLVRSSYDHALACAETAHPLTAIRSAP